MSVNPTQLHLDSENKSDGAHSTALNEPLRMFSQLIKLNQTYQFVLKEQLLKLDLAQSNNTALQKKISQHGQSSCTRNSNVQKHYTTSYIVRDDSPQSNKAKKLIIHQGSDDDETSLKQDDDFGNRKRKKMTPMLGSKRKPTHQFNSWKSNFFENSDEDEEEDEENGFENGDEVNGIQADVLFHNRLSNVSTLNHPSHQPNSSYSNCKPGESSELDNLAYPYQYENGSNILIPSTAPAHYKSTEINPSTTYPSSTTIIKETKSMDIAKPNKFDSLSQCANAHGNCSVALKTVQVRCNLDLPYFTDPTGLSPPENTYASWMKLAIASRRHFQFTKKWTKSEHEKLKQGVRQQNQQILLSKLLEECDKILDESNTNSSSNIQQEPSSIIEIKRSSNVSHLPYSSNTWDRQIPEEQSKYHNATGPFTSPSNSLSNANPDIPDLEVEIVKIKNMSDFELESNVDHIEWSVLAESMFPDRSAKEVELEWNIRCSPHVAHSSWTFEEDLKLLKAVEKYKAREWERIAQSIQSNRTPIQCLMRYQRWNSYKKKIMMNSLEKEPNRLESNVWSDGDNNYDQDAMHMILPQENMDSLSLSTPLGSSDFSLQSTSRTNSLMNYDHISDKAFLGRRRWSSEEDAILIESVKKYGERNWQQVASELIGRTGQQCLHRWRKTLDPSIRRGKWMDEEDRRLILAVKAYGPMNWAFVQRHISGRTDVQCRERWVNVLNPHVKSQNWTSLEDACLLSIVAKFGRGKWALVAKKLAQLIGQIKRKVSVMMAGYNLPTDSPSDHRLQFEIRFEPISSMNDPDIALAQQKDATIPISINIVNCNYIQQDESLSESISGPPTPSPLVDRIIVSMFDVQMTSMFPTDNQCWRRWKHLVRQRTAGLKLLHHHVTTMHPTTSSLMKESIPPSELLNNSLHCHDASLKVPTTTTMTTTNHDNSIYQIISKHIHNILDQIPLEFPKIKNPTRLNSEQQSFHYPIQAENLANDNGPNGFFLNAHPSSPSHLSPSNSHCNYNITTPSVESVNDNTSSLIDLTDKIIHSPASSSGLSKLGHHDGSSNFKNSISRNPNGCEISLPPLPLVLPSVELAFVFYKLKCFVTEQLNIPAIHHESISSPFPSHALNIILANKIDSTKKQGANTAHQRHSSTFQSSALPSIESINLQDPNFRLFSLWMHSIFLLSRVKELKDGLQRLQG